MMRLREQQQSHLLRQQPMMPGQMGQQIMRRNGMVPNLQKTVLQNNSALYVSIIIIFFSLPSYPYPPR